MAAAPYRVAPEVSPTGAALPQTNISVSAEDAGAVTAHGLQQLGAGLVRASDVFDDLAAQDMGNQYEDRASKILYGDPNKMVPGENGEMVPDRGYFGLRGETALRARGATEQQLQDLQKEAGGKTLTIKQRQMFDRFADNYRMQARARISNYADTQAVNYGEKVNEATAKLEFDKVAAFPSDPGVVEPARERVRSAYVKSAQLRGGGPELINEAMRAADRDVLQAQILAIGPKDPQKALRIIEAGRTVLGSQYSVLQNRFKGEAISAEADDVATSYMGTGGNIPKEVQRYDALIQKAASETGLDPVLGAAMITAESYGNPKATSSAGARGLTQLMPGTAREVGVTDVEDPEQNVRGGFKYLKTQLDASGGNVREALMRYNWGPGNFERWVKRGSNPDEVPAETREYVRKVQGYMAATGGASKIDVKAAQADLLQRKDLPEAVKTQAYSKMERRMAIVETAKAAEIKTLNDEVDATVQAMILAPGGYKNGTLQAQAERYRAVGDMSAFVTTMFLAQHEEEIKTLATSPKSAQSRIISGMLTGKAKALAEGMIAASKEEAAEAGRFARDEFSAVKEAVEGKSQIPIASLDKKIRGALDLAIRSQDPRLPEQIVDFVEAARSGAVLSQLGPTQQDDLMRELRDKVIRGQTTNTDLTRLNFLTKMQDQQDAAFKNDALATGAKLYNLPLQPINWAANEGAVADMLNRRGYIANQISANRDGLQVSIVTKEEMDGLRNTLKTATPQKTESIFRVLSGMPEDKKANFAALLAGKNNTGDFLTNSYGASLSLFSSSDPEDKAAASKILRGATIRKNMGTKAPPVESVAWGAALQDALGNVFKDTAGATPDTVKDAIASVYTHDMFMAGKIGEASPDVDMLSSAIKQVVGETVEKRGQRFFPPARGMTTYDVDKVLSTMTDGDVSGLRTTEGKPVTADAIRRNAQFSNVQDGRYIVRIPDGRNSIPSEILDYSRLDEMGRPTAYILDMRPLVERAQRFGTIVQNVDENNTPMGMRRDTSRRFAPQPEPR